MKKRVRDVPGQQLVHAADRLICDALDHVAQVRLRIDIVELGGSNQYAAKRGAPCAYAKPEGYVFVPEIPRTSTGKMMKAKLREAYKDWRWTWASLCA